MKKIVLFNHKGGVSKTTSTFYIGWMIAEMGHKVLLVDSDPQCNLSNIFMGYDKFDEYFQNGETKDQNIMDGVRPAFAGMPTPIKPVTCVAADRNANLFLLPGHMNLSEYDTSLNFAFTSPQTLYALNGLPGAFNDLIVKSAEAIGAEYVFIDLNPGLSTINEDMFISSDAFIIPTNPDTFSLMALKSLSAILPRWQKWKIDNFQFFRDSPYPLPSGSTKFIGGIPQQFNIRNGQPTTPFKELINELSVFTRDELMPKFRDAGMAFSDEQYTAAGISLDDFKLAEIKNFVGLAPKSYKANVPVYALSDEDLGNQGAVKETQQNNREEFRRIYEGIANKVIQILAV